MLILRYFCFFYVLYPQLTMAFFRILDPKSAEKTPLKKAAAAKKVSKSVAIAADTSSSEEDSESEESEEQVQIRSSKRKTPTKTPVKQSSPKNRAVAKKIAERVQTPARPSRVEAKKAVTGKDFWSNKKPEVIVSRTRLRTGKRQSDPDEFEQEKQVPSKKSKVSAKKPVQAAKKAVKKAAAAASKKKRAVSISPPPPRSNSRRKQELEERVCETCQQVFYSGTELALHELRHTGKELRITLDKYEIPEPVQSLERSYLFQQPVNLEGPARVELSGGAAEFSFEAPKMADEMQQDIFQSTNDNSNSATENAVDSIIESLQDEKEKCVSFDFFPPSSPKESSKPTTTCASLSFDFFDAPGMKTPPRCTAPTTSLSFDFFSSSPSKDCSMFSPPSVDPSLALKPNSDNPVLPLPSDSDNSMTLTPPKDANKFDKLDAAVREAVGDA
jgi:hypothetical protein